MTGFLYKLTPEEKKAVMKREYGIVTTVKLEGGLVKMCNLSDYIVEKATERGIEQGIEQGIERGLEELIKKKIQKNKSIEQIAEELESEPERIRPIYQAILEKKESL